MRKKPKKERQTLFITFIKAWWTLATTINNKEREWLSNPSHELNFELMLWKLRFDRVHSWARKRWDQARRENCKNL